MRMVQNSFKASPRVVASNNNSNGVPRRLRIGANDEGAVISGYLHKQLERGDAWKKMWFVVKEHVLYTYKAPADARAADSRPLLGYDFDLDVEVRRISIC